MTMSQCNGCLKPNPAHGRWWVGSALRSQHNMDRSSIGFESWRSHRGLRSRSPADALDSQGRRFLDAPLEVGLGGCFAWQTRPTSRTKPRVISDWWRHQGRAAEPRLRPHAGAVLYLPEPLSLNRVAIITPSALSPSAVCWYGIPRGRP